MPSAGEILKLSISPSSCHQVPSKIPRAPASLQADKGTRGNRHPRRRPQRLRPTEEILKKFVAVCLNEMLVAKQNAFDQRSDGGQFQRLLCTLQGALEVTVAVSSVVFLSPTPGSPTEQRTTHVSLQVKLKHWEKSTLKEAMASQVTTRQRGTSSSQWAVLSLLLYAHV